MTVQLENGQIAGHKRKLTSAYTTSCVTLSANSYTVFPVQIRNRDKNNIGILEPMKKLSARLNLLGAKVLVRTPNTMYEIFNPTQRDIKLKPGEKVALFTPVFDKDVHTIEGLAISDDDKTIADY